MRKGPWWYYERTVEGRDYVIHCRLPVEGPGRDRSTPPSPSDGDRPDEQVLLDENSLAGTHGYLDVANLAVSPGHTRLAYAVDTTGDERFTLRTARPRERRRPPRHHRGNVVRRGLGQRRHHRLLHAARRGQSAVPAVAPPHRQPGRRATPWSWKSPTNDSTSVWGGPRTVRTSSWSCTRGSPPRSTSSPPTGPRPTPRSWSPARQGVEYAVEHHRGTFLMLTNDEAENFRVVATPVDNPVAPGLERADTPSCRGATRRPRRLRRPPRQLRAARGDAPHQGGRAPRRRPSVGPGPARGIPGAMPRDAIGVMGRGRTRSSTSRSLRYEYSSLVTPRSVYDLDLESGQAVLRKRQPVLGDYDPARYATERRLGGRTRRDRGAHVDRRSAATCPATARAPCLLYGYGSYEDSMDPVFSSLRLSLLDRGFVFAIAHVRGGGELGRRWYEDGKLLAKPNTFTDFVACARRARRGPLDHARNAWWLEEVLPAACSWERSRTWRPSCSGPWWPRCPSSTASPRCSTTALPLTVIEWEEWGNPGADPEVYAVMKSYTPVRERPHHAVPGHARHRRTRGPSGRLLGACQVGPEAPRRAIPPGGCCSRSSSTRATPGPRAATKPGATKPSSSSFVLDAVGLGDLTARRPRPRTSLRSPG